ncbi:MAG TPA: tripartite tricarboxylate transporter substrate binding protein [Hyphomicrobiaceae bacterium]|jgi:tripartite-type tricarboxylate transporter receptor subunit TctC|nr:tripartite tricarboxylate transporter substrate binding protein [Hyphomicrobiaceae bacterium]
MRRILFGGLALFLVIAEPQAGRAQDWPSRPIKLVVPFSPGGTADTLGRVFARAMSDNLGQQVYVENRGGAGGMTASAQVARAEPDGYTLVVSGVASHVIAPVLSARPDYDPMRDFTHIAYFGGPPIVVVAHPSLGVSTFEQLVTLLRGAPEPQSYGSPGVGTQGHLVAAYLAQKLDLKLAHVPYKGANPAMFDLIGGHIKLASITWTTALAHIESGAVVPIAMTASKRLAGFPAVPTFAESGLPDLLATTWFSLSGPPGLSPGIVDRLNREVVKTLDTAEVRARLAQEGIEAEKLDAATFTAFVQSEIARWTPIVKSIGAKAE